MWRFGIFIFLLIVSSSEGKDKKEVCTLLMMCDEIDEVKSELAAVREEQENQKQISENQTLILENQSDILRQILEYQTQILEGLSQSGNTSYPSSCAVASKDTKLLIRVPLYSEDPFEVACDQRSHGGGWTIILRRIDGSQDFNLNWEDYKKGFGQLGREFFLGWDKIHAMTASEPQELLVLLQDHEGVKAYELYDDFRVGPEGNNYTLESLGFASGDARDSLRYQLGKMFSTKDRHNCFGNFIGKYDTHDWGITWYTFRSSNSLKRAVVMIRPRTSALN